MVFSKEKTVALEDARIMVHQSPTERIQSVGAQYTGASAISSRIIELYERFLAVTNSPESVLVELFLDHEKRRQLMTEAGNLGDAMYDLIRTFENDNRLYRLLVV